jgi:large subunit ribosomal protein L19
MDAIRLVEALQLKKDRAGFTAGDTVRVHVKVIEGEKERPSSSRASSSAGAWEGGRASFTVRRISYGVGVERTFPLHSPRIDRVEVVRRSRVRRSKLYYLRGLAGKAARLKEKRAPLVPVSGATEPTEQ